MDYPFLVGVDLIEIVEEFVESGGEYLLLDEIHRYNDFSESIKDIIKQVEELDMNMVRKELEKQQSEGNV